MEKEILFERLYGLLKDSSDMLVPDPDVNIVEGMFVSDLLSRWRDLFLELSGFSLEDFREWGRTNDIS